MIEPLGQNNAFSKNVEIEFFVKQKKNFIFRKREYELGGDINISENIELQGKKYIVFLNGDAMGKSIQGAGGVLVLGTVFRRGGLKMHLLKCIKHLKALMGLC